MQQLVKKHARATKAGFTFIELSLAILFVSLLALSVALVTSNISKIFTKGLVVKSINSTGSNLIEEFMTGLDQSPATQLTSICDTVFNYDPGHATSEYSKCTSDRSYKFVFSENKKVVKLKDDPSATGDNLQISGVFCTGKYSYVWNTGYVNNELYSTGTGASVPSAKLRYRLASDATTIRELTDFRLLRFEDPSRVACASQLKNYGGGPTGYSANKYDFIATATATTYDVTHESTNTAYTIPAEPVELLPANENALSLYSLYVASPSQDSTTNRLFYSGSFILATLRGGVDITADHDYCEVRDGYADDFDYCAINKFNFAAQATGK